VRLKSATIRNYRIHRDLKVAFDPRLTLIAGPNESGKSTLVEAIHRALFLRARVTGLAFDEMRSTQGGTPSVEVEFNTGGLDGHVAKTFGGARAVTTLALDGQDVLHDDAAEEKLAALLHVDKAVDGKGAANQLPRRWSHLWVWQGNAGRSPTEDVADQQQALVRRLQEQGGAAVMQSGLDALVLRKIRERRTSLFTDRKEPRKGTDLDRAEDEVRDLQAALQHKQEVVQRLEDAAARFTQAENEIKSRQVSLDVARSELAAAEKGLKRAEELSRELDPVRRDHADATAGIDALDRVAKDLAAARQVRDDATATLAPREKALKGLRRAMEVSRDVLTQDERAWEAARTEAAAVRLWKGALDAHLLALEEKRKLDALKAEQAAIVAKRGEQQSIRDDISRTPQVAQKDLKILQRLQQDMTAAEAAYNALGARVEIVSSREPVTVDGRLVAAGAAAIVTTDVEVTVGTVATLRVRPGGDTGIAEARQALETARRKNADRLSALSVPDIEAATAACEKLRVLNARIETLQADLDRLDADGNEEALRTCEQAHAEASRRAGNASQEAGRALPEAPDAARAAAVGAEEQVLQAERDEKSTEAALKAVRKRHAEAADEVTSADAGMQVLRRQLQDADVRIATIEDQHGPDAQRAERLLKLRAQRDQAAAVLADLQRQLDVLQPEHLGSDAVRLKDAITQTQEAINSATQERAAAREALRLSGSADPNEDLERTRAALARSTSRQLELRGQAEAVWRLAVLADEVQRTVEALINKPLEDAAQGYLECVFGVGARVVLDGSLQAKDTPALRVNREQAGLGSFDFRSLSGGTREQVGIAMRLAMAEVLACDYDGSLPIVLDDAFANSDPDRVRVLQRMLYRAADNGLQVIVLTCTPADYSTLGAREVRLDRPVVCPPASPDPVLPGPGESPDVPAAAPATPVSDGDSLAFLEKLNAIGGKSGNQSLRDGLGWSSERYEAVKSALVAANAIVPGQGRGGSVRSVEPNT
jgi:DNA repair exonuclease SbcCD ATPase subunit